MGLEARVGRPGFFIEESTRAIFFAGGLFVLVLLTAKGFFGLTAAMTGLRAAFANKSKTSSTGDEGLTSEAEPR